MSTSYFINDTKKTNAQFQYQKSGNISFSSGIVYLFIEHSQKYPYYTVLNEEEVDYWHGIPTIVNHFNTLSTMEFLVDDIDNAHVYDGTKRRINWPDGHFPV